jgi:hypothetical protein
MAYIEQTTPEPSSAGSGEEQRSVPRENRAIEDRRLLVRYHERGDIDARDELVLRFMPLARQLASRYRHAGELQ